MISIVVKTLIGSVLFLFGVLLSLALPLLLAPIISDLPAYGMGNKLYKIYRRFSITVLSVLFIIMFYQLGNQFIKHYHLFNGYLN